MEAQNAIYLDEETGGKGRQFKARFLVPGLVKYDYGVCLLTKENADKFIQGFIGCPVVINHQTVTDDNAKAVSVGNIFSVWFDEKDGYYWCNGIINDKEAIDLINKGYSVSCQYTITEYSDNEKGALHNGNPYDKVIENGKPEHLAIVNNPRYEGAIIAVNAIMAENADKWITIHPHGEESDDYRRLLIRDGESVEDAMHRNGWYKKRQAKEDKQEQKQSDTKEDKQEPKELDKKNTGAIYSGKTWREIFEKRLNPNESKSWWIEKVNKPGEGLLADDVFSHYQLRAEEGNKTKIPSELNDYIEEKFNTSEKYIYNPRKNEETKTESKPEQKQSDKEEKGEPKKYDEIVEEYKDYFNESQLKEFKKELARFDEYKGLENIDLKDSKETFKKLKPEDALERLKRSNDWVEKNNKEEKLKKRFYDYVEKNDFKDDRVLELARFIGGFENLGINKPMTLKEMQDDNRYNFHTELALKYLADKSGFDNYFKNNEDDRIKAGYDKFIEIVYGKNKASNSFVEQFKDTLYTALAEGIANRLGELIASNEDKWITIHPHGEESDDYRRLLIKEGETVEDAMHRQGYYDKRKAKDEKKQKEEKSNNKSDYKKKVETLQKELRDFDDKYEELQKKQSLHRRNIYQMYEDSFTREEADKKKQEYIEEHSKELDALAQEDFKISEERTKKQKELDAILEEEVETVLNTDIGSLDKDSLDKLMQKGKELFRMPIIYPLQLKLQQKILDIQEKLSGLKYQSTRKQVTEIAGVKKGKPMTFKEADTGKVNPNYGKDTSKLSFRMNCQSCVVCYQMRRNGFDVITKGIPINSNGKIIRSGKMFELSQHPEKAWINPKTGLPPELNICDVTTPKKAYKWLDENIKDGTYSFRVVWKGENSGHIVVAHRENGNLTVYDPQTNKEYGDETSITAKFFDNCRLRSKWKEYKPFVYRTDNLDINPDYADAIMEKS